MAGERDKFEVYKDKRGEWRWRRIATNGKIVGAASEGYKSKADCEANMNRGYKASDKWEFYTDKRGQYRWRRKASNGQVVGASSEGYLSEDDCKANAARQGYRA
ncbi:MAG: DUF1508 domain-containing protein [Alphaproteobacteria bacterium]|nr:MAG: DUF1508 domain-containing protein [Alphaproteobacteria bacterium]